MFRWQKIHLYSWSRQNSEHVHICLKCVFQLAQRYFHTDASAVPKERDREHLREFMQHTQPTKLPSFIGYADLTRTRNSKIYLKLGILFRKYKPELQGVCEHLDWVSFQRINPKHKMSGALSDVWCEVNKLVRKTEFLQPLRQIRNPGCEHINGHLYVAVLART